MLFRVLKLSSIDPRVLMRVNRRFKALSNNFIAKIYKRREENDAFQITWSNNLLGMADCRLLMLDFVPDQKVFKAIKRLFSYVLAIDIYLKSQPINNKQAHKIVKQFRSQNPDIGISMRGDIQFDRRIGEHIFSNQSVEFIPLLSRTLEAVDIQEIVLHCIGWHSSENRTEETYKLIQLIEDHLNARTRVIEKAKPLLIRMKNERNKIDLIEAIAAISDHQRTKVMQRVQKLIKQNKILSPEQWAEIIRSVTNLYNIYTKDSDVEKILLTMYKKPASRNRNSLPATINQATSEGSFGEYYQIIRPEEIIGPNTSEQEETIIKSYRIPDNEESENNEKAKNNKMRWGFF
jgi:hypothetical protein